MSSHDILRADVAWWRDRAHEDERLIGDLSDVFAGERELDDELQDRLDAVLRRTVMERGL